MEKLCQQFEDKLCNLLSFLTQLPCELEIIADEVDNENLKNALSAVAIESDQYAKELSAHLFNLDIKTPRVQPGNFQQAIIQDSPYDAHMKGEEILHICEKSEAFFTKLYTEVLNEYFPNTSLKDMMNYQLLGIRSAFMRIKLLNSLRFHN
jgi:hypothetical protein